ncbi:MAG: type II toxin-antitoxin system RelE/ParE family toxin [Alphaproteobacteria bacterium]
MRRPPDDSQRIRSKLEQYANNPRSLSNNVKRLKGRPGIRLRIGDWRVIFNESKETIDVLVIGPRGSVYGYRDERGSVYG